MSRRRYIYTQGGRPLPEPIEVDSEWSDAPRAVLRVDLSYMDGVAATDGTDISSKRRRREYMKVNNLADADDFKGQWAKQAKDRENAASGNFDRAARKEALARAVYQRGRR